MNNNLLDTNNYKTKLDKTNIEIVCKYCELVNEYLFHAGENIILQNQQYYIFVLLRGLNTITHIFNTLLLYTKNITLTIYHCKKAYLYYVEFMGQISEDSHSYLQLTSKDATLFVYKKTIFEINNDYRQKVFYNDNDKLIFKFINLSTCLYKEIIKFVLDNENLKPESRISYIMYIQKMNSKVMDKYLSLMLPIEKKIEISELFLHYISLLKTKNINDECLFLNLINLFFKKIHKKNYITKINITKKIYSKDCNDKLFLSTPIKFTNWLFNLK